MSQPQDPINVALAKEIDYNTLIESSVTQAELLSRLLNRIESLENTHKQTTRSNWIKTLAVIACGISLTLISVNYLQTQFNKWDKQTRTEDQVQSNANFNLFRSFNQNSSKQTKLLEQISDNQTLLLKQILNNAESN